MHAVESICASQPQSGEFRQAPWVKVYTPIELQFLYVWESGCIDEDRLKQSLASVLNKYPAIAGRVKKDDRACIDFCNAGVPLKVVRNYKGSACDVPTGETGPKLGEFAMYPAVNCAAGGPLLTAQLTCFEKGGCILGLIASHAVFDGWTFAMFMRDWSAAFAGETVADTSSFTPAELLEPMPEDQLRSWMERSKSKAVLPALAGRLMLWMLFHPRTLRKFPMDRLILHFSEEQLQALKRSMQSGQQWVSTNEALLAHLHPLMMDAFGVQAEPCVQYGAKLPVNLRGKVKSVGARSVGNFVNQAEVAYTLGAEGGELASRVHDAMRAVLTEEKLVQSTAVANHLPSGLFFEGPVREGAPGMIAQWNYQVSNPYFEVDFGLGRPTKAQPWSVEPVKVVKSLEGGVDVMIHMDPILNGLAVWAKDRWASVSALCGLSQLLGVGWFWRTRSTASNKERGLCALLMLGALALKRCLARTHKQYVQECFRNLKQHPKLYSFMPAVTTAALAGA